MSMYDFYTTCVWAPGFAEASAKKEILKVDNKKVGEEDHIVCCLPD